MTGGGTRWLAAAAVTLACGGTARPAAAADKPPIPKVLTEPRIAAQVKPGTVLIVHEESAPFEFATGKFNYGLLESLTTSDPEIVTLARRNKAAALQKGVQRYLLPDPAKFFQLVSKRTIPAEAVFTGSGAVVSGDGYIVTNAHVVAPDEEAVRDALIEDLFGAEVEVEDLATVLTDIDETLFGGTMSADVEDALGSAYLDFLDENSGFGETTKTTVVLSGTADPSERKAKGRATEVVELGEGYPGKDVAVLKVQASNLYALPLGDDGDAISGTKVFAVGYPGEATFDSGAAKGSQLEPSISSGTVSARRTVESGYSVIQHNAAIQHGSSGGPMVDESGRIVGLTTAGSHGEEPGTFYFSVPVTLVKEFLQRKNVPTAPSPATTQYLAALDQFDQRHYEKALKQLQALDRTSPGLPFVADRIAATQKKIDAGENLDERTFPIVPAAIAAGLLLLVVVALGIGLGHRARRKRRSVVQPVPLATHGAYGGFSPPPSPPPPPFGAPSGPPPTWGTPAPFPPPFTPPFTPPPPTGDQGATLWAPPRQQSPPQPPDDRVPPPAGTPAPPPDPWPAPAWPAPPTAAPPRPGPPPPPAR